MFKIPPGFKTYLFEFCGYGRWQSSQGAAQRSPPGCGGTRPKPARSSFLWLCWRPFPAQGSFRGINAKKESRGTPPSRGAYPLKILQMTSQRQCPRFRRAGTHSPWIWLYQVQCQTKACAFLGKESHSLTGTATSPSPAVRQYVRFSPTQRYTKAQAIILTPESVNRRGSETSWAKPRRCWSPSSPASYDKTCHSLDCCLAETFVISGQCLIS